ncbi:glucose dehydrogenase [FAD, quinone] [Plutella xylostella]|uniref:glucose dehydrogenase [FAD, quinone] n=1 Tax=Plutella xylostella TaxID=51655 RepID=UPI002032911D|nr:glucose dehydrogenase [FAD, quinone] [Plutella xylostella]
MSTNLTGGLCQLCDGTVECAPTAVLLVALIHTLYGHIGTEPDYFGQPRDQGIEEEDNIERGRTSRVEKLLQYGGSARWRQQPEPAPEYDFIVVGGGTAGCVLASRLSENKNWKVLLLEAGPHQPKMTLIPALTAEFKSSAIDWQYHMRPKKGFCQNQVDGCDVVQGRVLGGTSSINEMAYMRGSPADYDAWALAGNEGWSYSHILPYFKYSEGNYDKDISKNHYYHSTQGPLDVGRYPHVDDNVDILLGAFNEMGYNYTDINGKNQLGFMRIQTTSYFGERVSTYTAFIEPIQIIRNNLVIITEALVTKVIFKHTQNTMRAVGVEYMMNGTIYKALATKDVIVSAGAINTPKLLMQSGIGPKEYLDYLNIRIVRDLPVGANFHDHVSVCLPIIRLGKTATAETFVEKLRDITTYYGKGIGPLSANFQVLGLFKSKYSDVPGAPDIEIRFKGHDSHMYYDRMDMCVSLLTPNSRGQVVLNASDPVFGKPLIYPNFLKDRRDEEKLLEGIQIAISLFDTEVFKKAEYEFDPRLILNNECKNDKRATDDFWLCIVKHFSEPMHNYVGTCKMGPPSDPAAIVDDHLRVYGVERLRVVDASVVPKIPRGSTLAPVIMIAEKASDIIKTSWY